MPHMMETMAKPSEQRAVEPAPGDTASAGGHDAADVRVLRSFRRVFNSVKAHFQQVEKRAGVGGAQLWALSVIQARPGIGINELARAMDIHQSTASNLVKTLVERELIDQARAGADRRTVQLRLLAAGKRVLRQAPGPFTGVLPQALASLDAATLARLDQDLARLIAVLGASRRAGKVPLGDV